MNTRQNEGLSPSKSKSQVGYVGLSRGRAANHLYVVESESDGRFEVYDADLDRVAARLAARRAQTLATRQLPPREAGRWRSTAPRNPSHRRAEGISR